LVNQKKKILARCGQKEKQLHKEKERGIQTTKERKKRDEVGELYCALSIKPGNRAKNGMRIKWA